MIQVKEAVNKALSFAVTLLEPPRNSDLRLEEVESGQHNGAEVWFVTLSMPSTSNLLIPMMRGRDYKTFTVDGTSGEVLSMKIRELSVSQ